MDIPFTTLLKLTMEHLHRAKEKKWLIFYIPNLAIPNHPSQY